MPPADQSKTAGPSELAAVPITHRFDSTPVRKKYKANTEIPAETVMDTRSVVRRQLAADMRRRWVGPMPVEDFIREFLPPPVKRLPEFSEDMLRRAATEHVEAARYDSFINAIKEWIPDLNAVNTGYKGDKWLKPDVCLYSSSGDIPSGADFERLELWIEFKRGEQSVAFHDPKQELTSEAAKNGGFVLETKEGQEIRGQLAEYAGAHHAHQFRHFSFSILVTDDHIRFVRWDTAGACISSAFQYRDHPGILAEFLWRFNHLSAENRGHDTSVRPVKLKPDIAEHIKNKLDITDETMRLFEYHIPGLMKKGHAYGPRPVSQNRSIVSRCTRNLPLLWIPGPSQMIQGITGSTGTCEQCLLDRGSETTLTDVQDDWKVERIIYMKDTWRFISTDRSIEPEDEIYMTLLRKNTPNIPTLVKGGDVKDGQTRTQEFANKPWVCTAPKISLFCHYRLILGDVGHALTTFTSTKQLVSTVLNALKAHSHAFKVAGILHRDVSPGNIISMDSSKGLLIDWELARKYDETGNRRPDRTGTWQFMSANLLQEVGKAHTLADDLESFLHVLAWVMLSFVPAKETYTANQRYNDLAVFDDSYTGDDGFDRGGQRKAFLLQQMQFPSRVFEPKQPTPLLKLIRSLCTPFKSLYTTDASGTQTVPECLKSSDWFIKTIETALQDPEDKWPADDRAVKLPIRRDLVHETHHQYVIRTSQRISELGEWEGSKGLSTDLKRPASSTPEPSTKRPRIHLSDS